eukprot:354050-Chlamydomonas_euryale.AAC.4
MVERQQQRPVGFNPIPRQLHPGARSAFGCSYLRVAMHGWVICTALARGCLSTSRGGRPAGAAQRPCVWDAGKGSAVTPA